MRARLGALIDYAAFPAFLACTLAATGILLGLGVQPYLVSGLVIGALAVAAAFWERARPEREAYRKLDQPFAVDAAHYLFTYQIGYGLGLGACAAIAYGMRAAGWRPVWPAAWPLPLQIAFALFLSEVLSYWQHRLGHRVPWLWRFHALHHSGGRLNLMRAGRFHLVDIGTAAFFVFLPLTVLGAPAEIATWATALSGVFGILAHANLQARTPAWLDRLICTPAVHRHHHSLEARESDGNFSTTVMLMDMIFGTFQPPRAEGPAAMGIENDPVPRGYVNQDLAPFRPGPRARGP
jgi:sterol desaturase/sphingolipid hydroxylase (fatty acid hydroxylase superfamily)